MKSVRLGQCLKTIALVAILLAPFAPLRAADEAWLEFPGANGPGQGKHVVLISGDEEYRSEQALPQLAKILATHHGFNCTVLFAIDGASGTIDPNVNDNIPGLEALKTADLMIIATRFRDLPDEQMALIDEYLKSGRPVIGMRTATHAFDIKPGKAFSRYGWKSQEWEGGFGRQVLGETWVAHHGQHGKQSTRGVAAEGEEGHPILKGIEPGEIWGPTDVYQVRLPLPGESKPLVMGQVLVGMEPGDAAVEGGPNEPMMPVAWVKSYQLPGGKPGKVFTTTMGAATDLSSVGVRKMLVNAVYWCLGMEGAIPAASNVDLVGTYEPLPFGFGGFEKGLKPADLK